MKPAFSRTSVRKLYTEPRPDAALTMTYQQPFVVSSRINQAAHFNRLLGAFLATWRLGFVSNLFM
jgi:hypothetical protein